MSFLFLRHCRIFSICRTSLTVIDLLHSDKHHPIMVNNGRDFQCILIAELNTTLVMILASIFVDTIGIYEGFTQDHLHASPL